MSEDIKTMTEAELRGYKCPTFNSLDELTKFINDLTERKHDYGTCCYAMSLAATASFEYVASKLGVTGFQAGFAGLDIIKRVRNMDGPFMILDAEKTLYPQYDLREQANEWLSSDRLKEWQKEEAMKKLKAKDACGDVEDHWKKLANQEIKDSNNE